MDTNKIREKVAAVRMADDEWDALPGGYDESEAILKYSTAVNELLAELDKAPKVLTDDEIEHHAFNYPIWHRGKEPSRDGEHDGWAPDSLEEAFIVGAIWYHDNHSATGLTADEAYDVWRSFHFRHQNDGEQYMDYLEARNAAYRACLTAAIEAKR